MDAKDSKSTAISPFTPQSLEQADRLADKLAKSGLMPEALRGKPGDVLVMLITGHELGLSPMQAIRGLAVIKGKAVLSADMMGALVQSRRDVCEYLIPVESTDQKATYETKRVGHPQPVRMSWTIDQAKQAGLVVAGGTWTKHPAAMLRARCQSALVRAVYQDLLLGVYDADEAREFETARPTPAPRAAQPVVVNGAVEAAPAAPETPPIEDAELVLEPAEPPAPAPETVALADELVGAIESAKSEPELQGAGLRIKSAKPKLTPVEIARVTERYRTALGKIRANGSGGVHP
jgi:hypothetical protein